MARLCLAALKAGIEVDFVKMLIKKRSLRPDKAPIDCENWPYEVKIFTLGRFLVEKDGMPIRSMKKAQHKPLELVKALISFGGQEVSEDKLADTLWPEAEGDAAHQAFDTTLHRLRRLLGHENALVLKEGKLSLSPFHCSVDAWVLEDLMDKIDHQIREHPAGWFVRKESRQTAKAARQEAQSDTDGKIMALYERVLALYKGRFLQNEASLTWAIPLRDRLHTRLIRQLLWLGRYHEQSGDWNRAVDFYLQVLEIDNVVEGFYQKLMICYQALGYHAEAVSVYQRCKETLFSVLGIKPSSETEMVYQRIDSRRSG